MAQLIGVHSDTVYSVIDELRESDEKLRGAAALRVLNDPNYERVDAAPRAEDLKPGHPPVEDWQKLIDLAEADGQEIELLEVVIPGSEEGTEEIVQVFDRGDLEFVLGLLEEEKNPLAPRPQTESTVNRHEEREKREGYRERTARIEKEAWEKIEQKNGEELLDLLLAVEIALAARVGYDKALEEKYGPSKCAVVGEEQAGRLAPVKCRLMKVLSVVLMDSERVELLAEELGVDVEAQVVKEEGAVPAAGEEEKEVAA